MTVTLKFFRKSVEKIQFLLKSEKNDGYFLKFSKIRQKNSIFIKIWQERRLLYMNTNTHVSRESQYT